MPFDAYGYGQVKLSIYLARERRKGLGEVRRQRKGVRGERKGDRGKGLGEVRGQRKGDMGRGKGAEKRGKGTG